MIEFSSYYFIQEEDVEAIHKTEIPGKEYPFMLTVRVRSGREYSVSYQDSRSRDSVAKQIAQQVERNVRNRDRTIEEIVKTGLEKFRFGGLKNAIFEVY